MIYLINGLQNSTKFTLKVVVAVVVAERYLHLWQRSLTADLYFLQVRFRLRCTR